MGKIVFDKLLSKPLFHVHDPLYLTDENGKVWLVTVGTDGTLVVTSAIPDIQAGNPIGLLLALTYPATP